MSESSVERDNGVPKEGKPVRRFRRRGWPFALVSGVTAAGIFAGSVFNLTSIFSYGPPANFSGPQPEPVAVAPKVMTQGGMAKLADRLANDAGHAILNARGICATPMYQKPTLSPDGTPGPSTCSFFQDVAESAFMKARVTEALRDSAPAAVFEAPATMSYGVVTVETMPLEDRQPAAPVHFAKAAKGAPVHILGQDVAYEISTKPDNCMDDPVVSDTEIRMCGVTFKPHTVREGDTVYDLAAAAVGSHKVRDVQAGMRMMAAHIDRKDDGELNHIDDSMTLWVPQLQDGDDARQLAPQFPDVDFDAVDAEAQRMQARAARIARRKQAALNFAG